MRNLNLHFTPFHRLSQPDFTKTRLIILKSTNLIEPFGVGGGVVVGLYERLAAVVQGADGLAEGEDITVT